MATGVAPDGTQVAEFVLKQPPSGPPVDLDAAFRGARKLEEAKDATPDLNAPI